MLAAARELEGLKRWIVARDWGSWKVCLGLPRRISQYVYKKLCKWLEPGANIPRWYKNVHILYESCVSSLMNWDTFLRDLWFIYRIHSGLIGCQCVPEKLNSTRNMKVKKVSSTQDVQKFEKANGKGRNILPDWFLLSVFHFPESSPRGGAGSAAPPPAGCNILRDKQLKRAGGGVTLESHNFLFVINHNGSNKNLKVSTDCICLCGLLLPPSAASPSAAACVPPDWLLDLAVVGAFTTTKLCCGERAFSDLLIYRFFYLAYVPESRGQYQ